MNRKSPIALFDSGIGGLTVFQAISKLLPHENIIYLADNKRVPYGCLSPETIIQYVRESIHFLEQRQAKLIVLGCHTASVRCLPFCDDFSVPVIGMVQGSLEVLRQIPQGKRVAILGTSSTIQSGVYEKKIRSEYPDLNVISVACPSLVPMIELGLLTDPETELRARNDLQPLAKERVEAVLLACTHYPLIKPLIQKVLGSHVILLDASFSIAKEAEKYLTEKKLLNDFKGEPHHQFYVTDAPEAFAKRASHFLGYKDPCIELCQIEREKWK
jgi:glutamate racemase